MENEIKVNEYMSRKEYNKKNNSDVGYNLLVQNNIKRDDYARLNTGLICKVIGIKENNCNKKAIYFGIYEQDWFDCSAVENFSNNLADLIEVKDCVKVHNLKGDDITFIFQIYDEKTMIDFKLGLDDEELEIERIYTKEMMESISYKVERKD